MKKINYFIAALSIPVMILSGCKGNEQSQETATTEQAALVAGEYDLSKSGLNLIIKAPADPAVEQVAGAYEVKANEDFQLVVAEGAGDMNLMKSDIQNNDVNKFTRFLVEEPDAILFESQITEPEFHFFVVKKGSNNTVYEIQDLKGKIFTEEQARAMFEAAKASRVK